jgi:23S rRNA (cytosine1962-C5)-methyltransferase
MASIVLKPGRERSLVRRHPWVFSGAIQKVEGDPRPGETVDVLSNERVFLCRAAFSPHSQITLRAWSFDFGEQIDSRFFQSRLKQAMDSRLSFLTGSLRSACRLVNAESDGLPGVVVDKYADFLVCQFLSAGAEYWREVIVSQLCMLLPCAGIYERSDVDVRLKEGLKARAGSLWGETPSDLVLIEEKPCLFLVDIMKGQKTGFYLDQSENRSRIAEYAQGADVLNCFSYTGGFGIHALKAGALKVTHIESSRLALKLADENRELNGLDEARAQNLEGDTFQILRELREKRRQFDLVVLDPPKFVDSQSQVKRGSRGYKDINLLAFKLLRPGGILFTFSCSGLVPLLLFRMIVAGAALDAGRGAQVIRVLTQGSDHPTSLHFPEGFYLKGLVCRVY